MGAKFGTEKGGLLLRVKFHPIGAMTRLYDPKTEIFTEI